MGEFPLVDTVSGARFQVSGCSSGFSRAGDEAPITNDANVTLSHKRPARKRAGYTYEGRFSGLGQAASAAFVEPSRGLQSPGSHNPARSSDSLLRCHRDQ